MLLTKEQMTELLKEYQRLEAVMIEKSTMTDTSMVDGKTAREATQEAIAIRDEMAEIAHQIWPTIAENPKAMANHASLIEEIQRLLLWRKHSYQNKAINN